MKHKLLWHPQAWKGYLYFQKNDPNLFTKINELIRDIDQHPYEGLGKPEPLRHLLKGFWSRRINREHRLIYCLEKKNKLIIAACRYHYKK